MRHPSTACSYVGCFGDGRLCLNALQLEHAFGGRALFAEVMLKHYKLAFLTQVCTPCLVHVAVAAVVEWRARYRGSVELQGGQVMVDVSPL